MTTLKAGRVLVLLLTCWCLGALSVSGQSTDIAEPGAVRSNEVTGVIAARDLGDSRLTDHFFVFTGTPGDLLVTVEGRNLNGDVDVFTLTGMRPLLKFTVYEGSSPLTTKSIYLRKREYLILRIQARTPNDDEGTYRVRLGGSFEPISGEPEGVRIATETGTLDPDGSGDKTRKRGSRVSSVGARIDEPPPAEVAVAPTPEPERVEQPVRTVTTPRAGSRSASGRRPTNRRTRPATVERPAAEKPATEGEPEVTATTAKEAEPKPVTGRRRPGRRSPTARAVEKPVAPPEAESGPRLIIETNDGALINRFMTSVRRVTVENGQVVVVGKDGKVERFLLANVVRMSVGP